MSIPGWSLRAAAGRSEELRILDDQREKPSEMRGVAHSFALFANEWDAAPHT